MKLIIPLISYILAIFSFFFGAYDGLWSLLNIDDSLRLPMTLGTSIVILLIGHLINIIQIENNIHAEICSMNKSLTNNLYSNSLVVLSNSDEGLRYITTKLPNARLIKNTRMPTQSIPNYDSNISKKYIMETRKVLKNSSVIYRDIIVDTSKEFSDELLKISKDSKSSYAYKIIERQKKGFINFTLIEDINCKKEVIFGWITSDVKGYDENCFVSQDESLVSFFSTIFEELWNNE